MEKRMKKDLENKIEYFKKKAKEGIKMLAKVLRMGLRQKDKEGKD